MLPAVGLLVVSLAMAPFAKETQQAYARQDTAALRALMERADTRGDSLLVRYRLYPLTEDAAVLEGIPDDLSDGTAREFALLSGLWAYRAGEASVFRVVQYGRRSANLLEAAKARDATAPFVLLVEGQSYLFRPALAGRNPSKSVDRFRQLTALLDDSPPEAGIAQTEAQMWLWLALREAGHDDKAAALHRELLSRDLAPLYHEFLQAPPDV